MRPAEGPSVSRPAREVLVLERIASALERLVQRAEQGPIETVDVRGAAELLHTTVAAIYTRRHAGRMPTPISKRPLVWRREDVLVMEDE